MDIKQAANIAKIILTETRVPKELIEHVKRRAGEFVKVTLRFDVLIKFCLRYN